MNDKIIRFPGGDTQPDDGDDNKQDGSSDERQQAGLGNMLGLQLSPDQEKALQVVLSGMSFVCIGIQPTGSGADFFTAIDGDASTLQDAQPHLGGVIDRAFDRHDFGER